MADPIKCTLLEKIPPIDNIDYLPLTGGTVTGDLSLKSKNASDNNSGILRLETGTGCGVQLDGYCEPEDLATLTIGTLDGQGNVVQPTTLSGIQVPTDAWDAANKEYVDNTVAHYLPLTGGGVTGDIEIKIDSNSPEFSHERILLSPNKLEINGRDAEGAFLACDYFGDGNGYRNGIPVIGLYGTSGDESVWLENIKAPAFDDQAANKLYVDAQRPQFVSVTIPIAGTWTQSTAADGTISWSQTVTVQGILAGTDAKQKVTPWPADQASWAAWGNSGLRCFTWGENSLTFTVDTIPTEDINLLIELQVIQ